MMDLNCQGFLIKQQDLGEADKLCTFFTLENGKFRAVAKSVKKMQSKLAGSLQYGQLISLQTAGRSSLPTIIGASVLESYDSLQNNYLCSLIWFAVAEIINILVVDGQEQERLFNFTKVFLNNLNNIDQKKQAMNLLTWFIIIALDLTGFGIKQLENPAQQIYFSLSAGGFVNSYEDGGVLIDKTDYQKFISLLDYNNFHPEILFSISLLQLVVKFTEFQFDKKLKSLNILLSWYNDNKE